MRLQHHNLLWIFLILAIAILWFNPTGKTAMEETASAGQAPLTSGEKHGPVKTYDPDGNLQTIVSYEHGIKEGVSSVFYRNGQVMLEMPYHEGRREGESRKYYEDGTLYAVTPYSDDEITGIRTTYFRNEKKKAEIPYFHSFPGLGLREYDLNGEPKVLPQIRLLRKKEAWYFSIDDCRKATFYVGSLLNNRYLSEDPDFVSVLPTSSSGEAYLKVTDLPKGTFNVICRCTNRSGNPYLTRLVLTN